MIPGMPIIPGMPVGGSNEMPEDESQLPQMPPYNVPDIKEKFGFGNQNYDIYAPLYYPIPGVVPPNERKKKVSKDPNAVIPGGANYTFICENGKKVRQAISEQKLDDLKAAIASIKSFVMLYDKIGKHPQEELDNEDYKYAREVIENEDQYVRKLQLLTNVTQFIKETNCLGDGEIDSCINFKLKPLTTSSLNSLRNKLVKLIPLLDDSLLGASEHPEFEKLKKRMEAIKTFKEKSDEYQQIAVAAENANALLNRYASSLRSFVNDCQKLDFQRFLNSVKDYQTKSAALRAEPTFASCCDIGDLGVFVSKMDEIDAILPDLILKNERAKEDEARIKELESNLCNATSSRNIVKDRTSIAAFYKKLLSLKADKPYISENERFVTVSNKFHKSLEEKFDHDEAIAYLEYTLAVEEGQVGLREPPLTKTLYKTNRQRSELLVLSTTGSEYKNQLDYAVKLDYADYDSNSGFREEDFNTTISRYNYATATADELWYRSGILSHKPTEERIEKSHEKVMKQYNAIKNKAVKELSQLTTSMKSAIEAGDRAKANADYSEALFICEFIDSIKEGDCKNMRAEIESLALEDIRPPLPSKPISRLFPRDEEVSKDIEAAFEVANKFFDLVNYWPSNENKLRTIGYIIGIKRELLLVSPETAEKYNGRIEELMQRAKDVCSSAISEAVKDKLQEMKSIYTSLKDNQKKYFISSLVKDSLIIEFALGADFPAIAEIINAADSLMSEQTLPTEAAKLGEAFEYAERGEVFTGFACLVGAIKALLYAKDIRQMIHRFFEKYPVWTLCSCDFIPFIFVESNCKTLKIPQFPLANPNFKFEDGSFWSNDLPKFHEFVPIAYFTSKLFKDAQAFYTARPLPPPLVAFDLNERSTRMSFTWKSSIYDIPWEYMRDDIESIASNREAYFRIAFNNPMKANILAELYRLAEVSARKMVSAILNINSALSLPEPKAPDDYDKIEKACFSKINYGEFYPAPSVFQVCFGRDVSSEPGYSYRTNGFACFSFFENVREEFKRAQYRSSSDIIKSGSEFFWPNVKNNGKIVADAYAEYVEKVRDIYACEASGYGKETEQIPKSYNAEDQNTAREAIAKLKLYGKQGDKKRNEWRERLRREAEERRLARIAWIKKRYVDSIPDGTTVSLVDIKMSLQSRNDRAVFATEDGATTFSIYPDEQGFALIIMFGSANYYTMWFPAGLMKAEVPELMQDRGNVKSDYLKIYADNDSIAFTYDHNKPDFGIGGSVSSGKLDDIIVRALVNMRKEATKIQEEIKQNRIERNIEYESELRQREQDELVRKLKSRY